MNNPRIRYFEQEDVLHLVINRRAGNQKCGTHPKHYRRLNEKNEMIGVEILHDGSFLRDAVLDSIQAKTRQLIEAGA